MSWRRVGEEWIRVPRVGFARSAPWRLSERAVRPAFTPEQEADLASRFELDPSAIAEMCKSLSFWLDPTRTPNWITVRRSVAEKAGEATLRRALQEVSKTKERLAKQLRDFEHLKVDFRASAEAKEPFQLARASLAKGLSHLVKAQEGLQRALENPGTIYLNAATDRRQTRDERRIVVTTLIFKTWSAAGRRLSYTTDPLTSERGGLLIEFVQAVVRCVTEPPTELPSDTIVQDLKAFLGR